MSAMLGRIGTGRYGGLAISIAVLAVFLYVGYETQTWATRARLFATTLAAPAILLAAAQVIREARRAGIPRLVPPEAAFTRSAIVWAAAFFVSVAVIGLVPTIPLFAIVYLRLAAGAGWAKVAAYAVLAWLFVEVLFIRLLHIPLPAGAIPLPAITQ